MVICVTGQSGSGKSTLAKHLSNLNGYKYIDVDSIVHRMYNNKIIMQKYVDTFGDSILVNGKVDRKEVAKIALRTKSGFDKINNITWDYIENKIDEKIKKYGNVVLDYKFLPLTKYFNDKNIKILVVADENLRTQKIIARDKITKKELSLREKHSPDFKKYKYDYIINNDYSEKFKKNILKISCKR